MLRWIATLLCLFLVSCGGGGAVTPPDDPVRIPAILGVNFPLVLFSGTTIPVSVVSSEPVERWNWDFGSGATPTTSTEARPTIVIGAPGTYVLSVIVANAAGASEAWTSAYTVLAPEVIEVVPTIEAIGSTGTLGFAGEFVTFTATASNIPTSWEWELGQGASPSTSSDPQPGVVLRAQGTYTARVRATNEFGSSEWSDFTFEVKSQSVTAPPVLQKFGTEIEWGAAGATITLRPEVYNFPFDATWDFGGGATPLATTEPWPSITLGETGVYSGTVTFTNNRGSSTPHRFVYSVGGGELARMQSQWGGSSAEITDLVVMPDGTPVVLMPNPMFYDLTLGLTNPLEKEPDMVSIPRLQNGIVMFVEPDGTSGKVLTWADLKVTPVALDRAADGSLLVTVQLPYTSDANIAPGDQEILVDRENFGQKAILSLTPEGQVRWSHLVREVLFDDYDGYCFPSPDGGAYVRSGMAYTPDAPNCFLRKLDQGGALEWELLLPFRADGFGVLPDNGVAVGGEFEGSQDLDPTAGVDMRTAKGDGDAWLTVLRADGSHRYTRTWGLGATQPATEETRVSAELIAANPLGGVMVAGNYWSPNIDFDPGPGELYRDTQPCNDDYNLPAPMAYVLQLNETGQGARAESWRGYFPEYDVYDENYNGKPVLLPQPDGGYYFSFQFTSCYWNGPWGPVDLDPGPGILEATQPTDSVILAVTPDGNFRKVVGWDYIDVGEVWPGPGGLFVTIIGQMGDLDPGPEEFSAGAFVGSYPYYWQIFLDHDLNWSAPTAP